MNEILSQNEASDFLKALTEHSGGIAALAAFCNIDASNLGKMVRGKLQPSQALLDRLGIERATIYVLPSNLAEWYEAQHPGKLRSLVAEPRQDVLPRKDGEPRSATTEASGGGLRTPISSRLEPESRADRYRAFVNRFSGGRAFSVAEVRSWGYSPEELDILVQLAIKRGELSRRSEPRQ